MSAAGDDLREYLIVPPASSSSYSTSHFDQFGNIHSAPDPQPGTPRFHKFVNRKVENTNMEVDHAAHPSPISAVHASDTSIAIPVSGVMSLNDFLSSTSVQPVAVGAKSSQHTVKLHELHQKLAIPQPVFTYTGDGVTKFAVEVNFPGLVDAEELQGLKEEGRFNSKQEAKEASSKSALAVLERLVEEGRINKAKKPKGEPTQQQPTEWEELGENFVGQLLEFQRATDGPQPTYTDYQIGTRWACLAEIEGHDQPFGSLDAPFGSKKAAHQHAASCAVAHFKAAGTWPDEFTEVGGIKKRKSAVASPASGSVDGRTASVALTGGASATSQVAALAHLLSLSTPEYRFTSPDPSISDVHTVSCFFKNGGAHEGPIGEVRNIFGKKNAKNECARKTLQYLTSLKSEREAIANRLIAGIQGGAGIASVGVGMAMDGEENIAKKMEKETSDDDMDTYEDAMEH
ncbi:hypothetical protein N0V86_007007 [Didymella sp. IMI 355093]|nr:hypothetical protein N0V86_007007 [Didymella sp. IMI 355093]